MNENVKSIDYDTENGWHLVNETEPKRKRTVA